eukprot:scaffold192790_cov29-Tisochrysis_lutea.AAC.4
MSSSSQESLHPAPQSKSPTLTFSATKQRGHCRPAPDSPSPPPSEEWRCARWWLVEVEPGLLRRWKQTGHLATQGAAFAALPSYCAALRLGPLISVRLGNERRSAALGTAIGIFLPTAQRLDLTESRMLPHLDLGLRVQVLLATSAPDRRRCRSGRARPWTSSPSLRLPYLPHPLFNTSGGRALPALLTLPPLSPPLQQQAFNV